MIAGLKNMTAAVPLNLFNQGLPARLAVFGTGKRGRTCKARLEMVGVRVVCYLDNDPGRQGSVVDALPVVSPEEYARTQPDVPVILCSWAERALEKQLIDLGLSRIYTDNLAHVTDLSALHEHQAEVESIFLGLRDGESRKAYMNAILQRFYGKNYEYYSSYGVYDHPVVTARPGDCILDGGAASGDTLEHFRKLCQGDCSIHLFEPTQRSYNALVRNIRKHEVANAVAVNKALWDKDEKLCFNIVSNDGHSNHVFSDNTGEVMVDATSIDNYVAENSLSRVDLIKLDIEGSELSALRGAKNTLQRFHPKLQICMYHKPQDLWELPLCIKSYVPEYKMYVGLHSCCLLDLVLYCCV